jgi:indole-3-glycerol phosphate synthase/phosphoribosylanthranilate isomerase
MSIIEEIVQKRKKQISALGHEMGVNLPPGRIFPVTPFGQDPFIICEIKKRSPSKGDIAPNTDAVSQAKKYADMGVKSVSVLTESSYFSGSLKDLYSVKNKFPGLAVLRKDFILDIRDIEVSFRAGADAVLLIASMHNEGTLAELYGRAKSLGMEVLFEVHDEDDIKKAKKVRPDITGFNSRDLTTFSVDQASPISLSALTDWNTRKVFESGISSGEHAALALSCGFAGILVGESVMKDTALIDDLKTAFSRYSGIDTVPFWKRLYSGKNNRGCFVKICGLTREEDAEFAAEMGADILGFVFAESPRRASVSLLENIRGLDVLKAAVVVLDESTPSLPGELSALLERGLLDAVQFHGNENPGDCYGLAFPYYKAVRLRNSADIEKAGLYRCPRVLADTYVPDRPGGTGKRIPPELVKELGQKQPLWLAGGIGPENVRDVITGFRPELIDSSSLLESSPGKKDRVKIKKLFEEIEIGTVL